ncbi:MAG: hypothetical protein AWU54_599 [Candidatus Frackibacter sp. T328-2]|nr:MAG: hypothetical protein AWU54_599 [Candidatus Frackibacter sp. T328-2]
MTMNSMQRQKRRRKRDRSSKSKNKKNKNFKFTKGIIIFILIIFVLSFLFNLFIHTTSKTVLTEYGQVTKSLEGEGLFIRDETTVITPISGLLKIEVPEGKKVKASTLVAKVENNNREYKLYNHESGLISYYVDGLESTLNPKDLERLTYSYFQKIRYKINQVQNGDKLNSGRPVFKVINNFSLYLVMPISKTKTYLFESGMGVNFKLTEYSNNKFNAHVKEIITSQDKNLLVLQVKKFIPLFAKLRKTDVKLIRSSYNGIVVPVSALVNKNSKTGVLVSKNDTFTFNEVKVLSKNQERAIVKGISLGVKILKEPKEKMGG